MTEEVRKCRDEDEGKKLIFSITFVFLIIIIILSLSSISSAKPSGEIVYVATDGSGDFNCDGSDDQIEINNSCLRGRKLPI